MCLLNPSVSLSPEGYDLTAQREKDQANMTKSETFQEDIYPDTLSGEPSLSSDEWFAGQYAPIRLLKMASVYNETARISRQKPFKPSNEMTAETKTIDQDSSTKLSESSNKAELDNEVVSISSQDSQVHKKEMSSPTTAPQKREEVGSAFKQSPEGEVEAETKASKDIGSTVNVNSLFSLADYFQESQASDPAPSLSADDAFQRLLNVVEQQAETIENQAKRIERLENQQARFVASFVALEARLEGLFVRSPLRDEHHDEGSQAVGEP